MVKARLAQSSEPSQAIYLPSISLPALPAAAPLYPFYPWDKREKIHLNWSRSAMNSSHRHDLSSSVNSADAESHRGTPETNSTALSPEDLQPNQCRTAQVTSTSNQPPAFFLGAVPTKATSKGRATESTTASHQDPFVTINSGLVAARSSNPPKLSPVASNFTPSGLMENTGGNILSRTLTMPVHSTTSAYVCTPNSLPSASMVPETPYDQASLQGYLSSATAGTHVSLSSQASPESLRSPGSGRQPPKSGRFSSDSSISRSVMISHMDRGTPPADVESIISVGLVSVTLLPVGLMTASRPSFSLETTWFSKTCH